MATYSFSQVDVFAPRPLTGNPVAVVHDATGLDDAQMAAFARWTNLSETTFLLPPTDPAADYRLRIFTPGQELPFAGHPTLGSAHAWLAATGARRTPRSCRSAASAWWRYAATATGSRSGRPTSCAAGRSTRPTSTASLTAIGLDRDRLLAAEWIDNGPGWMGLHVDSADTVLALRPDFAALREDCGVIGAHDDAQAPRLGAATRCARSAPARPSTRTRSPAASTPGSPAG